MSSRLILTTAPSNGFIFSDALVDDIVIYGKDTSEVIHIGPHKVNGDGSNLPSPFTIDASSSKANLTVQGNILAEDGDFNKIDLAGDIHVQSNILLDGGQDAYISMTTANMLSLRTNDADRLRILSSGEMGIGTNHSPATGKALDVKGSVLASGNLDVGGTLHSVNTATFDKDVSIETNLIVQNGNLGVGISTPDQKLHVIGNILASQNIDANGNLDVSGTLRSGNTAIFDQDVSIESDLIVQNGNVGVGTSTPDKKLHVIGNILASQDIVAESDFRVKKDIVKIEGGMKKVRELNGYTFLLKEGGDERRMGVIAQELLDVIPEVVHHDQTSDRYSVAYGNMFGVFIEAFKDLAREVDELKKKMR